MTADADKQPSVRHGSVSRDFGGLASAYLLDTYMSRIDDACRILPPGDLWWRPHPDTTSVGNLLLHLEGNVKQWVCEGVGICEGVGRDAGSEGPWVRNRSAEFAAGSTESDAGTPERGELLRRLRETVDRACQVLGSIEDEGWSRTLRVQGFEVTVLEAVFHVVEHFSWHCGQITWVAKARAGEDHGLAFYDDAELERAGKLEGSDHVGG